MNTKLFYNLTANEQLLFFGDELNFRHDFKIIGNRTGKHIDTLLFFDSRGISKQFENSLVDRIIHALPEAESFLLVARPLEITTWMTTTFGNKNVDDILQFYSIECDRVQSNHH
jgi:hypothetical protein